MTAAGPESVPSYPPVPPQLPEAVTPGYPIHPLAPAPDAQPWVRRPEVRAAAILVVGLAVLGVAAGLVWWVWSPARGIALALGPNTYIPDETEAFIAADGRFAFIGAVLGVVTGVLTYCWRSVRSPLVALALAVGSVIGALIAGLIGEAFGGGANGGADHTIITPRLEVHAPVLYVVQAFLALIVYGVLVTMSSRDDLGTSGREAREPDPMTSDQGFAAEPASWPTPRP